MTFGVDEWIALGEIIWVNVLLSGDNAVVIAMACRSLPPRRRGLGMALGAGAAIALRIAFTLVVVTLLGVPYLKLVGALALSWIAIDLLRSRDEGEAEVAAHGGLWRAVGAIAAADVVMSLDNVIAIAGVAGDHYGLLVLGLVISAPMIVAGSAVVLAAMDRFPLVVWAGAALLGFLAGQMFVSDTALAGLFGPNVARDWSLPAEVVFVVAVLLAGRLFARSARGGRPAAQKNA